MNPHLKTLQDLLKQNNQLTEQEKASLLKAIGDADKQWNITEFKLDRTEKVKKTTAILLEETIEELEQKRKAVEMQNHELEIESSLERVRTAAMAMKEPADMPEVCRIISNQLESLKVKDIRNVQTAIINEAKNIYINYEYYAKHDKKLITEVDYSHPLQTAFINRMLKGPGEFFTRSLTGKELKDWYEHQKTTNQFADTYLENASSLNYYWYSLGSVALGISTYIPLNEEEINLFKRFRNVFELAYRRYADIEKAVAQAREAEIELALERVRAKTMAMQQHNDLLGVITLLADQLINLGFDIHTVDFSNGLSEKDWDLWVCNIDTVNGNITWRAFFPWFDHPFFQKTKIGLDNFKKGIDLNVAVFNKEEKDSFLDHIFRNTIYREMPEAARATLYNAPGYTFSAVFLKDTWVSIGKFEPKAFTDEQHAILRRFATAFGQAYIRFLDLQKAEAQAKEATIEAALEKVRGKAMAMHNSNDVSGTASMVFTELRKLGIDPIRCGVGLLTKESLKAQLYSATSSADGDSLALIGWVMLSGHLALQNIYKAWLKQEDYFLELSGEQLRSYYEHLAGLSLPVIPDWKTEKKQYGHFIPFSIGSLYAWSETPYNDEEIKILNRFATIVDLTFRRYIELQNSEAIAKEAVKRAALDRIRADIASMRTTSDLDRITPLIWKELTTLGIPFIRCGVFIMDDSKQLIETFLSTPDGKAIAAFDMPYDTPGNMAQVLHHWHDKKSYVDRWDKAAFAGLANMLVKQGEFASPDQYLSTLPDDGFYLHFLPFLQGMLYVGNTNRLNDDEINLIQSVADAFSTAYARYEDFNKLEAAKQQVEKTLIDLKQAQTQLIQAEKMASLGELIAGIAHEIQNPLNFVNNFSEVSNELLDEMKKELESGNWQLATEITDDVKQNLEKILHHGKRADAIVKGMLQHSRTSTGQKEFTDINNLADEYLRLAFHGLRAKDKTFNTKFETDFDSSIGKINIIPQDIGRVLLNLINNAFYATSQRQKAKSSKSYPGSSQYVPTVTIVTKKLNARPDDLVGRDKIEIKVGDNGNGIPQNIVDKIFQPFFTTKPTGQGTGLGLSLAYDIIKAHGGEIRVESKEGESSEFIILFPLT